MNIELKDVHIGNEIRKQIEKLRMSKKDFALQFGVQQQHVNRILDRDTMETKKLMRVCQILDTNIFALFCSFPTSINAYLSALENSPEAKDNADAVLKITEFEIVKATNAGLINENKRLIEQVEQLKSQLNDKDAIISLLNEIRNKI